MKRMIVYKSCSYVIMALLCTACAAGSPEEDMEDRVRIDPVAGGYYPSISPSAQTRGATPDGETLKDRPIFLLETGVRYAWWYMMMPRIYWRSIPKLIWYVTPVRQAAVCSIPVR